MISDSIPNASIAMASSNPKDLAKKKKGNRSAKLKQSKLDARREQWLSQAKNKGGCEEEVNCGGGGGTRGTHSDNKRGMPIEKLEIKPKVGNKIYKDVSSVMHLYSDSDSSPSNSPTSQRSISNYSGLSFTDSSRGSSSSGRSSSSSRSNGFFSIATNDNSNDSCFDDWEAMADAMDAIERKDQEHSRNLQSVNSKAELMEKSPVNCGAWRVDDAFRPRSLPDLSKKYGFPLNTELRFGWACKNAGPVPTSCPICCEDLDCTDTSFLPCLCGFMLCLFCHKRILEEDGRCPGCRKQYDEVNVDEGNFGISIGSFS
ncbi:hypothetical protein ABFS83_09G029100 [Erythranthe nasuta]